MIEEKEDPKLLRTYKGHKESVLSVAYNPQGGQVASGSLDATVCIWNVDGKGDMRKFLGHRDSVRDVAFSPNGELIASASQDETVRIWENTPEGHSITLRPHESSVRSVTFSTDGQLLLTSSDDKTLKVFKFGNEINYKFTLEGHTEGVKKGVFSPDTRLVASGGDDAKTIVWDVESHKIVTTYNDHKMTVNDVKFSHDGTCLVSCSRDRRIKLYDTRVKREILSFDAHGDSVHQVDYHINDKTLLSCSADSKIKIWDLKRGRLDYTLYAHEGIVTSCAFSKEGDQFVTGGEDALVLLWNSNLEQTGGKSKEVEVVTRPKKTPSRVGTGATTDKKKGVDEFSELQKRENPNPNNPQRAFTDDDIPAQVTQVVDRISQQLEAVVNSLLSIERRVGISQQKISKLNLLIYKKLQRVKATKQSLFSVEQLKVQQHAQFKETIRVSQREEDVEREHYDDDVQV